MMTRLHLLIITCCLGIALGVVPGIVKAEATTPGDVRATVDFATGLSICSVTKEDRSADCEKQITKCDASKWAKYVSEHVNFTLGTPQPKNADEIPAEVLAFLSRDSQNSDRIPALSEAACYCTCGEGTFNSSCTGKVAGTPFRVGTGLRTKEECMADCEIANAEAASKCAGNLPLLNVADSGTASGQATISQSVNSGDRALCFSKEQCDEKEGTWEAYNKCPDDGGRCYAPPPSVTLNTALGPITEISGFDNYVLAVFRYMLSIVVFVATVMFIWGAFRYLFGSAVGGVGRGKKIMQDAVIGMILLLCSVGILRTINPETAKLKSLKVYMVNTELFVQSAYCKDLPSSTRLAEAGAYGSTPATRESVEASGQFTQAPSRAKCGYLYYPSGTVSEGACQGTYCEAPNEVCVSCASGEPKACDRIKSEKKVCDPRIFAGSITYKNERYPEEIYLVAVCEAAQVSTSQQDKEAIVAGNMLVVSEENLSTVGKTSGDTKTDTNDAGDASYYLNPTTADIQKAVDLCNHTDSAGNQNSLRGFLIGVQYNDGAIATDEIALLSKQNCAGGSGVFDGYATGRIGSDSADLARAYLCGLQKSPPKFLKSSSIYWTKEEIEAAIAGRKAQSCDFDLSNENAPSDPEAKFCSTGTTNAIQSSAPECAQGVQNGSACDNTVRYCRLNASVLCSCVVAKKTASEIVGSANVNQQSGVTQSSNTVWSCH